MMTCIGCGMQIFKAECPNCGKQPVLVGDVLPEILKNILKPTAQDREEDKKREKKLKEQRSADSQVNSLLIKPKVKYMLDPIDNSKENKA